MKVKQRKKTTRQRGCTTHGWGARQRHKGHGCSGGFGMAGTGKRGDQKKQSALIMANKAGAKTYFGKQGFTSRGTKRKKNNVVNLLEIKNNFNLKSGKIELKKYKILSKGEGFKAEIYALSASKLAIEKMEKAGGKIILPVIKEKEVKPVEKKGKETGKESKKEDKKKESGKKKNANKH